MALGALPTNAPYTLEALAKLSDELSYLAGDRSTDSEWYFKRARVTGIYVSTGKQLAPLNSSNSSNFRTVSVIGYFA